jgi:hypothetical protein
MTSFTFPQKKFESIIRDLLLYKGKTVFLFEKCESDPEVIGTGSPGNNQDFEDIVCNGEDRTNSSICAVQVLANQVFILFSDFRK